MGLTAPRTTSGSPFVTPPVSPPALFVRWIQRPPSPRPSITSWTAEPNRRVCSNPSPISTPFTMLMLITAAASAASSRRSQWTYDPSPIGSPWATTSNTPPTVSPPERAQDGPRHAPGRNPGRGLAGGGALEDVANVVEPVFQGADEVGVAGPDAGDRGRPLVAVGGG